MSSVPAKLEADIEKGATIQFTAEISPFRDDTAFRFFKRPTTARLDQTAATGQGATRDECVR